MGPDIEQPNFESNSVAPSDLTDGLAATRRKPTKVEPGSEWHLTLMMAKYNLNFVTGKDRQYLLAWGRDVWDAAKAANIIYTPKPLDNL